MLLADKIEKRYVYRQIVGTRDGMMGRIEKQYFDAIYENPDEAEAQYQFYLSCTGGMS
jgi:hypothetical protein